jgi:hypothetical protein
MSSSSWQYVLARLLIRHAKKVLHPLSPTWADAMEAEMQHLDEPHGALKWALGCVRASYAERYARGAARPLLSAVVFGALFGLLSELLTGFMAARSWPGWYVAFSKSHRHLALELWSMVVLLPVMVVAFGIGLLGARMTRRFSTAWAYLYLGIYVLYVWAPVLIPGLRGSLPLLCLWQDIQRSPASYLAGLLLPCAALCYGFRVGRRLASIPSIAEN